MIDLHTMVAAMTPAEKAAALRVLDAISRPLQVREIERLLRAKGVPRPRAVKLAGTLKGLHIIAVAGPEHG
ncbi:hypothetical protein WJT74_07725 [Sphingomicrobium sp. XHP0239]|uniref:hypothetical protein n=1 Tax=Sphingomicrobium maritimum TaxID=3133972 RepID=UPI0031CC9EB6